MNKHSIQLLFATVLVLLASTGCSSGPFTARPRGDNIAQCRGYLTLDRGVRSQFSLDLIRRNDELALFASVPGARIRYGRVEDISFNNNNLVLKLESGREIVGRITGGSLEFKGAWEDFRGKFTLELK